MQNNKISTKVVIGKVGVLTKQEKLKINSPKKINISFFSIIDLIIK